MFYLVHQEHLLGEVSECVIGRVLVFNTHMKELFFEETMLVKPLGQKMELVVVLLAGKVMKRLQVVSPLKV